jgi:pimeloyl-ACP methyl ester carboxylesterase
MPQVELCAGTIEYQDTGGDGPAIVMVHGLVMDGTLWRNVVADLADDYRCVTPTLPLGGHRRPMRRDADLTLAGQARLLDEFLGQLGLDGATVAFNDWGGAQPMIGLGLDGRIGRLVLCSCEAFDNYPPGLPGRFAGLAAKLPGGINLALQPLRLRPLRRLPMTFGWMCKRPVPDEVMDAWLAPVLGQRAIRRDLRKYAGAVPPREQLMGWAESQRGFDRPVLVAWAAEDRVMPREHGPRLAALFPDARLVEIPDSYTLVPEDQPRPLARAIREFVAGGEGVRG